MTLNTIYLWTNKTKTPTITTFKSVKSFYFNYNKR